MGSCACVADAASKANKEIKKKMLKIEKTDKQIKKLLLLGTGSSGKSTIFKQLKCIHSWGLDTRDYDEARYNIRANIVSGIIKLMAKSIQLYKQDNNKYKNCYIDLDSKNNRDYDVDKINKCAEIIAKFKHESFENPTRINSWDTVTLLADSIKYIWSIKQIKNTYNNRGKYFSFPENMEHFFDKVTSVFDENYKPTHSDVMKSRIRTTGMNQKTFIIKEVIFNIYDVGGQRNERRKWIHQFEGVTAIIFVAALNHYDCVLFEDENVNALHESVKLFGEMCNLEWFTKTAMILFLNKDDLFREKIRNGISLKHCFDKNNGWFGDEYTGNEYKSNENSNNDDKYFKYCYETALNFIKSQYTKASRPLLNNMDMNLFSNNIIKITNESNNNNIILNRSQSEQERKIFIHVVTATDKNNVEKVFWDTQNIIVRKNLFEGGLQN